VPPFDRRSFLRTGAFGAAGLTATTAPAGTADTPTGAPAFRLGLVTYNLAAAWDLATVIQVCKAGGISPVELRTTHRHGVEPSLTKDQRREVRQRFADAGVAIWGCGTVCEFHSPEPTVVQSNVETCKRFVDLAADLGAKGVKVRPNGLPKDVPVSKTLEQIGRSLVACGRAGAAAGVEIWLEVHGNGTSLPANVQTIMDQCDHPQVGLTWNSNVTDVAGGSVAAAFKLLSRWIRSCHINDLYRDQTGGYPYRELFRLLRGIGYDRATLCEVGGSIPDAKAGAEFLRYYKALWTEQACR
jgi:sugar phosphate isomerase/epimerase